MYQQPDIPQGKEALAKATKQLMSLDRDTWNQCFNYPYQNLFQSNPTTPTKRSPPAVAPTANPKRQRSSPPPVFHPPQRLGPSQGQHPLTNGSGKPSLLSPSQKKANHIQSEQKRRANIRRGYEKLCETVPALRDAIREEEEGEDPCEDPAPAARTARAKRGRARTKDGTEKVDGRAGPRSENVVLAKTIDYINDLLSERAALLSRLQRARDTLPRGHPTLMPPCLANGDPPPWEREWKGGEGKTGSGEEDEDEDDE